eukprot:gene28047-33866_t
MVDKYKAETLKHISRYLLIKALEEAKWDEASTIVYNDETYARIPDSKNDLPLHIAVRLGCTPRLVELLLTAYPDSIRIKDHEGSLALHLSVRHHKGRLWVNMREITMILYRAFPQAISTPDGQGNIALHVAIRYQGPDEMIRYLMQAHLPGLSAKDSLGNLALHLAIQFEASYMIIHDILRLNTAAASVSNDRGLTPLHRVAFFNSSVETLQLILQAHPAAAYAKDKRGNLPIHLAFLANGGPPDEAKLKIWLAANPCGLSVQNLAHCTPLTIFHVPQDNSVEDFI